MVRQEERAADENHQRGNDDADLQQSSDELFDRVVTGAVGAWLGHTPPVTPLYSICTAITTTTAVNRLRSHFTLARVEDARAEQRAAEHAEHHRQRERRIDVAAVEIARRRSPRP